VSVHQHKKGLILLITHKNSFSSSHYRISTLRHKTTSIRTKTAAMN